MIAWRKAVNLLVDHQGAPFICSDSLNAHFKFLVPYSRAKQEFSSASVCEASHVFYNLWQLPLPSID